MRYSQVRTAGAVAAVLVACTALVATSAGAPPGEGLGASVERMDAETPPTAPGLTPNRELLPVPVPAPSDIPSVTADLTDAQRTRCFENTGIYTLGPLTQLDPVNQSAWKTNAYRDLQALLIGQNPDFIGSVSYQSDVDDPLNVIRMRVLPAYAGVDVAALVDRARASLIPEYQPLVSMDDIEVADATGYGFSQLCSAYAALKEWRHWLNPNPSPVPAEGEVTSGVNSYGIRLDEGVLRIGVYGARATGRILRR